MYAYKVILLVALAGILLSGCSAPAAAPETPTAPVLPTGTPQPTDTATPTIDSAATESAQATGAIATARAKQAEIAVQRTQETIDKAAAAATKIAGGRLTATVRVEKTETALAASFSQTIARLNSDGIVGTQEGEVFLLKDFDEREAKLNYFFPHETGYTAENFVLEADMYWISASMNANWPTSGCGLVFGRKDLGNYNFTFLGLDGNVYTMRWTNDASRFLAFKHWGTPDLPEGRANFRMVVWDKRITIFVNDEIANTAYDGIYTPGDIALTLISGTNKGFGTRCQMKNIKLFIFD